MTDATLTEGRPALDHAKQPDDTWTQYVTFAVDDRLYGVEITKAREIKGWSEPTELPNSAHAMRACSISAV